MMAGMEADTGRFMAEMIARYVDLSGMGVDAVRRVLDWSPEIPDLQNPEEVRAWLTER